MSKKTSFQVIISSLILVFVVVLIAVVARSSAEGTFRAYFLNVGQGDAEYLKLPDGSDILIDGGPDNSVLNQLGKVMDFGDREINLVILSHPHADHLTGLIAVLERYKVDEVWESGVEYSSGTYNTWKSLIKDKNIPDRYVKEGDSKELSDVKIEVLYPPSSFEDKSIDNLNNASIVNRVDYGNFSVLFTGDAETEVQSQLLNKNVFADILKVAHHGSNNGLSENFLKAVRPTIAIIEVGLKNTYGHPAVSTLNLLRSYGIRIYRTDQNGVITIISDGNSYSLQ